MQKITDVEKPVEGKFYTVTLAECFDKVNAKFYWTVVLGDLHKDPELGVNFKHFHIDGRFYRAGIYRGFRIYEGGFTNNIIGTDKNTGYQYFSTGRTKQGRRKLYNVTTGIKPPPDADKYWDWYNKQIGKSCKGKRCPHLGYKMEERNGALHCPLHGLKGDIKTEVIIKKSKLENFFENG